MREVLVESPGTAPGSEPFIMGAFIAIVRFDADSLNIGAGAGLCKSKRQRPARGGRALRFVLGPDQNPALIASNSSIIFLRKSAETGVCENMVVVTGSTKDAARSAAGMVERAASLAWA